MDRDVFLRGRTSGPTGRTPAWASASAGAVLGGGIFVLARALGVWELIGDPILPMLLLCLVGSAVFAPTRWGAWLWGKAGVLLAVLLCVAGTPIVRPFLGAYVRVDPVSSLPADAIVILSGNLSDDGHVQQEALDRMLSGLALVTARQIPNVALSVVTEGAGDQRVSSEQDQRALAALIAPQATLSFIREVHSTHDEAVGFAAMARARGWRRVILVTSPMHSARACATLERAGLPVECAPAASRVFSLSAMHGAGNRLLAFRNLLYEAVATRVYRLRGWV